MGLVSPVSNALWTNAKSQREPRRVPPCHVSFFFLNKWSSVSGSGVFERRRKKDRGQVGKQGRKVQSVLAGVEFRAFSFQTKLVTARKITSMTGLQCRLILRIVTSLLFCKSSSQTRLWFNTLGLWKYLDVKMHIEQPFEKICTWKIRLRQPHLSFWPHTMWLNSSLQSWEQE